MSRRKRGKLPVSRVYDVETREQALYAAEIARLMLASPETGRTWDRLRRAFPECSLGEIKNKAKSAIMEHWVQPLIDCEGNWRKRRAMERAVPVALDMIFQVMINREHSN